MIETIERILAFFFPPKLDSVCEWSQAPIDFDEQGACGNLRIKKYRNGIERVHAEGI